MNTREKEIIDEIRFHMGKIKEAVERLRILNKIA